MNTPRILNSFENSFKNIRLFKKNSIFYYYCKLFLVIFLIPFFIFNTIMATYYYKNLSLRSEISARQTFNTVSNDINSLIDETSRMYLSILQEPISLTFMTVPELSKLNPRMKELTNLDEMLDRYSDVSTSINSITMYSNTCGYVLSRGRNGSVDKFKDTAWYKHKNLENTDMYYFEKGENNCFYICYNVFNANKPTGLIVFEIDTVSVLSEVSDEDRIILSDKRKNAFFSSGYIDTKRLNYDTEEGTRTICAGNTFFLSAFKNELYINMAITESHSYVWDIVFYIVLSLVITLLISFVLAIIVSIKSYSTLDKILLEIEEMSGHSTPSDDSLNEIGFITSSIMGIHNKNTMLQEELTASAYALKQMQIEALQMQFNPHFLFNALNSLSMKLTKDNGIDSPYSSLIVLLSDILSESLNTGHYMVKIRDEISYARKYLDFQKHTDSYFFDTTWEIDESVLDCYTVKLSMQPLIENAVKHGVKSLRNEEKGIINISIGRKDKDIVFEISNNCKRIDKDSMDSIRESLKNGDMPSSKNIGLKNVNKRIQLVFGDEYGCDVWSSDDMFNVEMTIPSVDKLV